MNLLINDSVLVFNGKREHLLSGNVIALTSTGAYIKPHKQNEKGAYIVAPLSSSLNWPSEAEWIPFTSQMRRIVKV